MDLSRREFFQSLAAFALAVGVLPVGFPPEPSHLGIPYEIIISGPAPNNPPSDPLNEISMIGWKWRIDGEKYGNWNPCYRASPRLIRLAHKTARLNIEQSLKERGRWRLRS